MSALKGIFNSCPFGVGALFVVVTFNVVIRTGFNGWVCGVAVNFRNRGDFGGRFTLRIAGGKNGTAFTI